MLGAGIAAGAQDSLNWNCNSTDAVTDALGLTPPAWPYSHPRARELDRHGGERNSNRNSQSKRGRYERVVYKRVTPTGLLDQLVGHGRYPNTNHLVKCEAA